MKISKCEIEGGVGLGGWQDGMCVAYFTSKFDLLLDSWGKKTRLEEIWGFSFFFFTLLLLLLLLLCDGQWKIDKIGFQLSFHYLFWLIFASSFLFLFILILLFGRKDMWLETMGNCFCSFFNSCKTVWTSRGLNTINGK